MKSISSRLQNINHAVPLPVMCDRDPKLSASWLSLANQPVKPVFRSSLTVIISPSAGFGAVFIQE